MSWPYGGIRPVFLTWVSMFKYARLSYLQVNIFYVIGLGEQAMYGSKSLAIDQILIFDVSQVR